MAVAPLIAGFLMLAGTVTPSAQADPVSDASDQLAQLTDQQAVLTAQASDLQDKLTAAQAELGATTAQIQSEQATVAQLRPQIGQIALQQFQDSGLSTTAAFFVSTNTEELLNHMVAIQQVNDTAVTLLQTMQLSQARLDDLQASQEALITSIQSDQAALLQSQSDLAAKVEQAKNVLNQLLQAAAAKAAAASTEPAGGNIGSVDPATAVPDPSSHLINPEPTAHVTSPFGTRINPTGGGTEFHTGIDLAIGCGTPIPVAANGLVISAAWGGGYGNRVVVENGIIAGHHIVTTYNHMTSWAVSPGQSVTQGQIIGYIGETGRATGCHLHFEVYSDGQLVDPALYIF